MALGSTRSCVIPELLIVGDAAGILDGTRGTLEAVGHRVRTATSGVDALTLARLDPPDLMIIDMVLPDLSGLGLCRAVREDARIGRIPIVMLSTSDAEMDRIVAFEIGVDDFVQRCCSQRELALRVGAILRRTLSARQLARSGPLRAGMLVVDPERRHVRIDGEDARLTAREFDVLVALMRHPGRVLGRSQILEEIWGVASDKTVRVVDTHVKWIRRKIGPAGHYIETLRGVGYRFTDRVIDESGDAEPESTKRSPERGRAPSSAAVHDAVDRALARASLPWHAR